MFERFSDESRRAVVVAQEEARSLNHNYIGPEHLLLGALTMFELRGGDPHEGLPFTVDEVRAATIAEVGLGDHPTSGHVPFTSAAKAAFELSLRECLKRGHRTIGPEHIALGLTTVGSPIPEILAAVGADVAGLEEAALAVAGAPRSGRSSVAPRREPVTHVLSGSPPESLPLSMSSFWPGAVLALVAAILVTQEGQSGWRLAGATLTAVGIALFVVYSIAISRGAAPSRLSLVQQLQALFLGVAAVVLLVGLVV
jgi:hypothetical protein